MYIKKIKIENFRLLKNSILDLEEQDERNLSLLIGRNNSGKTSFIMVFDKFLKSAYDFGFDDFPLELRERIFGINEDTDEYNLSIKLILEIDYSDKDSLENISDLILDLSPDVNMVKILFECLIDKKKLLAELKNIKPENKRRFIKKNLKNYLQHKIYIFDDDENLTKENRSKLIEKDRKTIDKLINYQVIHAKRSVSSSEANENSKKILSSIASAYFNKKTENKLSHDDLDKINSTLLDFDTSLEETYKVFFDDFLNKSKEFLGMENLRVISDLQSKEILSHHSKIVYGDENNSLPEHLNGLGFMNILYLLLQIEIKKEYFTDAKKDINILFIEEPEAHTHPQIQTIFIQRIKNLLNEISSLQTFITTHSPHIVKNCDFKEVRYFFNDFENQNVSIKNFYTELKAKYKDEKDEFNFLQQYLTISSSELFFAEKIIFIEGLTERLLLPYFIKLHDDSNNDEIKLSSQNISTLEVGANAKAFNHFIEFLGIKSLIITDIDSTIKNENGKYIANKVKNSTHTSNATLKYFLKSPEFSEVDAYEKWYTNLKENKLNCENPKIKIQCQSEENGHHGRSFEEAFIIVNVQNIVKNYLDIKGLTADAGEKLANNSDFYILTDEILNKKSAFASSLLWLALTKDDLKWNVPAYIKEGLVWISQ